VALMSTYSACANRVRPRFPLYLRFKLTYLLRDLWGSPRTLRLCAFCTTRCESDATRLSLRDRMVRRLGSFRDRRNSRPFLRRTTLPCRQQRETPNETGQGPCRSGEDRTHPHGYTRSTETDLCRVSAFSEVHSLIQPLNAVRNQNVQLP